MKSFHGVALAALLISVVGSLLVGCGSRPPAQWISLPLPPEGVSKPDQLAQAAGLPSDLPPMLVVRRVNLPQYLQSSNVRYREQASVLAEWPDVRWADRLEVGVTEHLMMRLRRNLPGWTVCDRHCPVDDGGAVLLQLDLAPLDYIRSERILRAEARWSLTQRARAKPTGEGDAPLASNRSAHGTRAFGLTVLADNAQGQAAAMGVLLDQLAVDLAREAVAWNGP